MWLNFSQHQVASSVMDAKTFLGMNQTSEDTWTLEVTERIMTPGKFMFGGCGLA